MPNFIIVAFTLHLSKSKSEIAILCKKMLIIYAELCSSKPLYFLFFLLVILENTARE